MMSTVQQSALAREEPFGGKFQRVFHSNRRPQSATEEDTKEEEDVSLPGRHSSTQICECRSIKADLAWALDELELSNKLLNESMYKEAELVTVVDEQNLELASLREIITMLSNK
jgi:hypothetical protein